MEAILQLQKMWKSTKVTWPLLRNLALVYILSLRAFSPTCIFLNVLFLPEGVAVASGRNAGP